MARLLVPAAALIVSACGGDSGSDPKTGLTNTQQTKIAAILQKPEVVQAIVGSSGEGVMAAAMMPFIASNMTSLGTIDIGTGPVAALLPGARYSVSPVRAAVGPSVGSYKAFGGQYLFSVKNGDEPEVKFSWTGIIAFNDLNNPTDIITVGVTDMTTNVAPTSFSTLEFGNTSGNPLAFASFIKISGSSAIGYSAVNGSVAISSATFSSAKNCGNLEKVTFVKTCTVSQGSVKGSFNFSARQTGGEAMVQIPATTLDVPAARLSFSLDLTDVAEK